MIRQFTLLTSLETTHFRLVKHLLLLDVGKHFMYPRIIVRLNDHSSRVHLVEREGTIVMTRIFTLASHSVSHVKCLISVLSTKPKEKTINYDQNYYLHSVVFLVW